MSWAELSVVVLLKDISAGELGNLLLVPLGPGAFFSLWKYGIRRPILSSSVHETIFPYSIGSWPDVNFVPDLEAPKLPEPVILSFYLLH